jgi:hypothetical protein
MNRLSHTRCYLAGAIENDCSGFTGWRNKVKNDLSDLNIQWLDPADKPIAIGKETEQTFLSLRHDRESGNFTNLSFCVDLIRKIDLRMVDISDFMIVNIDPQIPTFGTHEEIYRAVGQGKPVLVRTEGGRSKAPFWWFSMLDINCLYGTWDEVYDHLRWVAKSRSVKFSDNSSWIFFDWMGEK